MAIKACERCGIGINAYGRQRFCTPCGLEHQREGKRLQSGLERQLYPERVAERQKRWRDANKEKSREWAKRPQYREAKQAWRDEQRFGGLKAAVLKRDNNCCLRCGSGESDGIRNITIHHINGNKAHNVMGNLITLCRACHASVHNRWHGASRQDELRALLL